MMRVKSSRGLKELGGPATLTLELGPDGDVGRFHDLRVFFEKGEGGPACSGEDGRIARQVGKLEVG